MSEEVADPYRPDEDQTLWATVSRWVHKAHNSEARRVSEALQAWAQRKGFGA